MTPEPAAVHAEGDSILRGGAWTTFSGFLPQVYTLLISIAAARVLGPDEFGRQSYIAFAGITVHMVLTAGLGIALTRSVAEALGRGEPARARGLVAWTLRIQTRRPRSSAAASWWPPACSAPSPSAAWIVAGAAAAIAIVQSVPAGALVGAHRFRDAAVVGLVTGAITVPIMVAVLAAGGGIVGMFAVEAIVAAVNLVWIGSVATRHFRRLAPRSEPAPDLERAALKFAGLTTIGALLTFVVWKRSEFFFLAHYSADSQIALYSIAFAVVTAVVVLPERLAIVATPVFARLKGADDAVGIREGFGRTLRLMVLAMLPLAAGIVAVGPLFLELIYGDEYADVGPVLIILAAGLPFSAVSVASTSVLAGLEDAINPLIAGAVAACVNVVLAFALIPDMDAVGAALANVGGQLAAAATIVIPAIRAAGGLEWRSGPVLRGAVAAIASGASARAFVELLGGVPGLILGILAGVVVFGLLAVGLRVLSRDDAVWADTNLGHLLGGRVGSVVRRAGGRGGH